MRDLPFERAARPWFPLDAVEAPRFDVVERTAAMR
jgi:hypothetical protein